MFQVVKAQRIQKPGLVLTVVSNYTIISARVYLKLHTFHVHAVGAKYSYKCNNSYNNLIYVKFKIEFKIYKI